MGAQNTPFVSKKLGSVESLTSALETAIIDLIVDNTRLVGL